MLTTWTQKYCKLYDPKYINYEGFEADQNKDIKIYYLGSTLANNFKDFSVDDETIIKYIEGQLAESASVECKTFSKAVNYSSVKYTKEDIEIGKKDNFCGQLMAKEEEVTEEVKPEEEAPKFEINPEEMTQAQEEMNTPVEPAKEEEKVVEEKPKKVKEDLEVI